MTSYTESQEKHSNKQVFQQGDQIEQQTRNRWAAPNYTVHCIYRQLKAVNSLVSLGKDNRILGADHSA